jgi:hypothetical protein
MNAGSLTAYMVLALAAVVVFLAAIVIRRRLILARVRTYNGGKVPSNLDFGAVFGGFSTDTGMLRPKNGVVFATAEELVFVSSEIRRMRVAMPWKDIEGWSVVGEFRGRPLHRSMIAFTLKNSLGGPVDLLFNLPRPEFWTSLANVAMKSLKKV